MNNVYHVQINRSTLILSIALMTLCLGTAIIATFDAAMKIAVGEIARNRVEVNNAIEYTNSVRREIAQSCGDKLSTLR
jgi:glucose-6-phosphate-specific signal transduction histidine kinase